jgi:hypothetical protein
MPWIFGLKIDHLANPGCGYVLLEIYFEMDFPNDGNAEYVEMCQYGLNTLIVSIARASAFYFFIFF